MLLLLLLLLLQIRTMASGPSPGGMKFFLYAKTVEEQDLFLVQLVLEASSGDMAATLKASSSDPQRVAQLLATLKQGLHVFSPN